MEISFVSSDSIRIKGKNGSLVVDPSSSGSKIQADGVIALDGSQYESAFSVEGSRLTIIGPGEYEIAGIKITTIGTMTSMVHQVRVDNIDVVVGSCEAIEKLHDKLNESGVVIANTKSGTASSAVTSLAPRVVVLYGDKAIEEAKKFGKEDIKAVAKYQTTADKLPADMEVVVLG